MPLDLNVLDCGLSLTHALSSCRLPVLGMNSLRTYGFTLTFRCMEYFVSDDLAHDTFSMDTLLIEPPQAFAPILYCMGSGPGWCSVMAVL